MSNQLDATIAKRFDITVKQNQTFNATIIILDDIGSPINLNGGQVKMSIRQTDCGCNNTCAGQNVFDSFNLVFKQDLVPTIGGGSFNVLQFFDLIRLDVGTYKYDLLVHYPNGQNQYLLTGSFKVKRSYTEI